jgi:large subunit ribosomal protein L36e
MAETEEKKVAVKVKFVKAERSGLRVGLARGKKVALVTQAKATPASRRGSLAPRVRVVREIIRDVCGLAPYEKRILDVIKVS